MTKNGLTTARWILMNGKSLVAASGEGQAVLDLINEKLGYAPDGAPESPIAPLPALNGKHVVALCLGHGRSDDEGNVGAGGVSEEDFNSPLIDLITDTLRGRGINVVVVKFYQGSSYTNSMIWLANELKRLGATCAVEFHFNAFNKVARGHEFLHWEHSKEGVKLAGHLLDAFDEEFSTHASRGLKRLNSKNRGALFVSLTHCPAVIAEPFFGDNPEEWRFFSKGPGLFRLMDAYVAGIENWLRSHS